MRAYDDLRAFVTLSETLHFGRAARARHLSPSGLSRTLQRLEHETGVRLFERDPVRLTEAGATFLDHANQVLRGWDATEHRLRSGPLAGSLRIYCTVTAAQSFVPDLLARFRSAYPDVRLHLATGYAADALDRLRAGTVDVAVAPLPDRLPDGIVATYVTKTPLRFVRASDAAGARVDWRTTPVVLPSGGLVRLHAERWFQERGIVPVLQSEVEGHEAVLTLVALGVGVGVVPLLVLEKSALRDQVQEIEVRPALAPLRIGVCVRDRALDDPVVAAFWAGVGHHARVDR
jgi:LysR family positive regulator for ilvC